MTLHPDEACATPAEWIERHSADLEELRGCWVAVSASGIVDWDASAVALKQRLPLVGRGYSFYFVPPEGAPALPAIPAPPAPAPAPADPTSAGSTSGSGAAA